MQNISLDIETLGTQPGCVVLSVAAIEFGPEGLGRSVHVHIDAEDSVKHGLLIEPRTVKWWMEQGEAARTAVFQENGMHLKSAMQTLSSAFDWVDTRVWANGSSFDFPILKAAYQAVDLQAPWAYYDECCLRTLRSVVSQTVWKLCRVHPTLAHDALQDAIAQAETINGVMQMLKSARV